MENKADIIETADEIIVRNHEFSDRHIAKVKIVL